jgi:hypothetical protein
VLGVLGGRLERVLSHTCHPPNQVTMIDVTSNEVTSRQGK